MSKKTKIGLKENYNLLIGDISFLLESARRTSARAVNSILTATYWEIGRRIVEYEQSGEDRAEYGHQLLKNLSYDLTKNFGRGFSADNLESMRLFYLTYSLTEISETVSRKFDLEKSETSSRKLNDEFFNERFPLPWSHYVMLVRRIKEDNTRKFYESEALRSGWSVRQLDRQISSQFYERTLLSKNKSAMIKKGEKPLPEDIVTPEEEIKDPFILEFLGLKDEYSENDLEEALISHLENFLLELGSDFAFIGRQKRLRIGDEWYRIDLLFFHRKLKCLVVIDLKVGKFTHADAGQMHLYLNYAKENWTNKDENPPVGLILCAEKDNAVAKYALEGLPNKVLAAEYKLVLPNVRLLTKEIELTKKIIESRKANRIKR
jgi:predicted nuclease of restriction endonuclease-like (RecB) superfamily